MKISRRLMFSYAMYGVFLGGGSPVYLRSLMVIAEDGTRTGAAGRPPESPAPRAAPTPTPGWPGEYVIGHDGAALRTATFTEALVSRRWS